MLPIESSSASPTDPPDDDSLFLTGRFRPSLVEPEPHKPHFFVLEFVLSSDEVYRARIAYQHTEEAEAFRVFQRFAGRLPFRYYGHTVEGVQLVKVLFFRYTVDWTTETIQPLCGRNYRETVAQKGKRVVQREGGGSDDAPKRETNDVREMLARLKAWATDSTSKTPIFSGPKPANGPKA